MLKLTNHEKFPRKPKRNRVLWRVSAAQNAIIKRAAGLEGRSVSDFLLAAAQEKALRIIESMETTRLNAEEGRRFAEALAAEPREPGEHQLAALENYRRLIRQ